MHGVTGSSPVLSTKLSEHFGSTGEKPSDFKVFGFFMTENFQSIRWLNGNGAEVQTGFEPLFFHIQADFQWQRPFSEGRDDRFSEKTKKNLSQSYGRWIVGFHEPMTSALFCAQKGRYRLEVRNERRKRTAEGKISA